MTTATKNLSGEAPKKRNSKLLPDGPDWTFELLERYHKEIKTCRGALSFGHLSKSDRSDHV